MNGVRPRISVISPSLNHGRFLRATIESVLAQSFASYEHIIVDGGSQDETLDILREYKHVRWVSEPDDETLGILGVYRKAFAMARGDYIIQCCVSDGFLHQDWFGRCASILDADQETSLVWGLPQYMNEEGDLGRISYVHLLDEPPPQKAGFLPFWLATAFILPEGNYCVRREVFDTCFPKWDCDPVFRLHPALGFLYNFNRLGYMPIFLPVIANYGRVHGMQRGVRVRAVEAPIGREYQRLVGAYTHALLRGEISHEFKNGASAVVGQVSRSELPALRRQVLKYRLRESRYMRLSLWELGTKAYRRAIALLNRARLRTARVLPGSNRRGLSTIGQHKTDAVNRG